MVLPTDFVQDIEIAKYAFVSQQYTRSNTSLWKSKSRLLRQTARFVSLTEQWTMHDS